MTCLLPERVAQLHLTTLCNLACAHCYSTSGPDAARFLDPDTLVGALAMLRKEGYDVVSLSGGEPFLYPELTTVVAEARRLGFRISIVTNGAAVTEEKAAALAGLVSTVAVSFDGLPDHHDAIRRKPGGFQLAVRGLRRLQKAGMTCGVICCVTRTTLPDVVDLYEFAAGEGAALFQLRPLALTGRARTIGGEALDADDCERLVAVADLLAGNESGPFVQCDLVPAGQLVEEGPGQFPLLCGAPLDGPLSDLVNPLVVAEDGGVRPYVYGVAGTYELTGLTELATTGWPGLPVRVADELSSLLARTFAQAATHPERFVDFYGLLTDQAADTGAVGSQGRTGKDFSEG